MKRFGPPLDDASNWKSGRLPALVRTVELSAVDESAAIIYRHHVGRFGLGSASLLLDFIFQPTGSCFYSWFLFVLLEKLRALGLIFLSRLLLFLFHVFLKLCHDVFDLVLGQLRFTSDGVFDAGGENVGINVYFLPAKIESNIHADAVADLVLLVFKLR